tara:strand:- start:121 stop:1044 length:924 start_codon:yes stop_codon:yes gene_type:complete
MNYDTRYVDLVGKLRVYKQGGRRAPHKPLMLLIAIAKLLRGQKTIPFGEAESELRPLLEKYAPPVVGRHQPGLPYWHLQTDEVWEIPGGEVFPRQAGGFPQMAALRSSSGHLLPSFADALESSPELVRTIVNTLLEDHFAPSIYDDILDAIGLETPVQSDEEDRLGAIPGVQRRDPRFRQAVLRAYEHRCAVTGFRASLGGTYFGCEAAHVRWHAYEGPDTVDNGFAVEPTLHKLFDAGAWTLTDNRRILVSAKLTGTDSTVTRVRDLHGEPLQQPLPGEPQISVDYIRWHRDPELGGVFRYPGLPL